VDQFNTTAKLWPSGTDLDLGTDFNSVTVPANFDRHAANFVTSMDGMHSYQFLFWDTGRHLTNKRHVHWSFNVGGWGHWTATRWYGTPPTGPGHDLHRVHADAFNLNGDALISGTPIDGPASTFAPGAFPYGGSDHEINTASGAVTVVAKDPFNSQQFAGWLQLIWGGDDSSTFYEDDSGASPGSASFYDHASGPFSVAMGGSADLLATYGNSSRGRTLIDWAKYVEGLGIGNLPIGPGDPGPDDIIRLLGIQQLIQQTRPGQSGQPEGTNFEGFIEGAARMSAEELKLARQSVQTSLDLGRIALSTIDAQLKRGAG
jgi:hypothetical protein